LWNTCHIYSTTVKDAGVPQITFRYVNNTTHTITNALNTPGAQHPTVVIKIRLSKERLPGNGFQ
jgi:hypothetical protein